MFGFGKKKSKTFLIPAERIKRLINSNEGCIATDRITVDGAKVVLCIEKNHMKTGSQIVDGDLWLEMKVKNIWIILIIMRFISKYKCNYDLNIIPFLDSQPGAAYFRNENGEFERDTEWEIPEE